jgi:hypothetical protein
MSRSGDIFFQLIRLFHYSPFLKKLTLAFIAEIKTKQHGDIFAEQLHGGNFAEQ